MEFRGQISNLSPVRGWTAGDTPPGTDLNPSPVLRPLLLLPRQRGAQHQPVLRPGKGRVLALP